MKKHILLIIMLLFGIISPIWAQQSLKSLPEVEKQLKKMAYEIVNHDSLEHRTKMNKEFTKLLRETLQRPESYDYPFDSLETVSILRADDNTFRVFTWCIADVQKQVQYGTQQHYYFGIVHRKYISPSTKKTHYLVIPLVEATKIVGSLETTIMDNANWLGGLYYPEKGKTALTHYEVNYWQMLRGSQMVKFKHGTVNAGKKLKERPKYVYQEKPMKKQRRNVYMMLGWNGSDNTCNYKFIDLLWFDPQDSSHVLFGSDAIFFDKIPKFRAVFKYSEYAPFSLNLGTVDLKGKKKEMIVYDHLGAPVQAKKMQEVWEMGPDGSFDAIGYDKKRHSFRWYKNVQVSVKDPTAMTKDKTKAIEKRLREANQQLDGAKYDKSKDKTSDKTGYYQNNEDKMKELSEKEREKQKALGAPKIKRD